MPQNVTNLINTFKKVFTDIKEVRWSDGDINTANLATHKWEKQLPVLTDSGFDFSQDDPTVNSGKVYGLKRDWFSTSEDGSVKLTLQIPTVADGVLGWLWTKSATAVKTAAEDVNGVNGTFEGVGYTLTSKTLEGTMMIISGDGKYALIVRHLRASTSFAFSDPKSKPFAVTLTASLSGDVETENATNDFDMAFLEFKKTTGGATTGK